MLRVLILALGGLAASAVIAVAATPVTGSISGPVTSVAGQTFVVRTPLSPTGSSKITIGSSTTIDAQIGARRTALKPGECVLATGQRAKNGKITASSIMVSKPGKTGCTAGFGPGGGRPGGGSPPAGQPQRSRPPAGRSGVPGRPANFGFAFGTITKINGSTVTLRAQSGTTTVILSTKTSIRETVKVHSSAIKVNACAFVRGTSTDKGVTVKAQSVNLSPPGPNGCNAGFPGRGRA